MNESDNTSREAHIKFGGGYQVKILSDKLYIIKKACKILDITLSEFCRMSTLKEARKVLLNYREDKIEYAKRILFEEELRNKRKASEEEEKKKERELEKSQEQ